VQVAHLLEQRLELFFVDAHGLPRVSRQPGASSILEAHPRADSVSTPREHGSCDAGRSTGLGTTTSPLVRLASAYTSSRGRSRSRGCAGCGFAGAVSVRCVERSAGGALAPDQPEPAPAKLLSGHEPETYPSIPPRARSDP
jgi:hypothetical protein